MDLAIKEIVREKNNIKPENGLTKPNKRDDIIKILNLDLIFKREKITKLIHAKVIESLPIHDVHRWIVGKKF